jgi:plasmid stabilization system protein ParE
MDYKVVLAPRAVADLRDIVCYVAPDRPEAAKRLGLALIERTNHLASFRDRGGSCLSLVIR